MKDWAPRLALLATAAAAVVVLLAYQSDLEAAFLVPKFAVLEIAASFGLLALVLRRRTDGGPRWALPVTRGVWLVLATTAISWLVTRGRPEGAPYGLDAMARWAALFGLACGASILRDASGERRRLAEAVTVAAAAVAMLGLVQHWNLVILPIPIISVPGSTFGNRNLAAEIMAIALPFSFAALLGPQGDRSSGMRALTLCGFLAATLVELAFLGVTRTRGSWLAAGSGLLAVGVLVVVTQRVARPVLLLAGGALVVAGVVAALPARLNSRDVGDTKRYASVLTVIEQGFDTHSPAFRTRLGFWRRSARMIGDHPLLGVGPGNWPRMFPHYAEPDAAADGILSATLVPRQAHDDYVERTSETGLLGLAALLALGVAVAKNARRRIRADAGDAWSTTTGAAGALVALAALGTFSFPLEMPGTIALAGLSLGLVVADGAVDSKAWEGRLYLWALAGAAALLVAVPMRAERSFRGSRALAMAEGARLVRGIPGAERALPELEKCLAATPSSYLARLRTAQMLLREKRADDAIAAAKSVIELEPYSPNGWGVLASAYRMAEDPEDARDAATHGLGIMHDYPLALDVRADAEQALGDVAAAREDRARVRDLADHAGDDATRNTARSLVRPDP